MERGLCRLCLRTENLCNSHALPDALFGHILRENHGKAIVVTDDLYTPIQYSSDTWGSTLLCQACESALNERYDHYGISVFKGLQGSVYRGREGVTFLKVDCRRLRMFFLSILWRMSVSTHDSYRNVRLAPAWEEDLRSALAAQRIIPPSRYQVSTYRLIDSSKEGGFTSETLRKFITAPFPRRSTTHDVVSVCYVFFGFLVEIVMPKRPSPYGRMEGVIKTGPVHFSPYLEVLQVPEILAVLVRGLAKHEKGLSKVA